MSERAVATKWRLGRRRVKEADSQFANTDYEVIEGQGKTPTEDGDMNLYLRIFENLKEASGSNNQDTTDQKTFFSLFHVIAQSSKTHCFIFFFR